MSFFPELTPEQKRIRVEEILINMIKVKIASTGARWHVRLLDKRAQADRKFCSEQCERLNQAIALMEGAEVAFAGFSRFDLGGVDRGPGGKPQKLHELSKADSDEIDRMLSKDKHVQAVYDHFSQLRAAD